MKNLRYTIENLPETERESEVTEDKTKAELMVSTDE